jgi:menaquinone-dependent protoporphyrinogen oxidase
VEDLTPYDGIVIGGALCFGRWHEDAARLLARHWRELVERPPESRVELDKALAKVPEVEPRSIADFGGVVDPAKLRFRLNRMPASDVRDWGAIDEWADDVATTLEAGALAGRKS